jgi:DNA polymerase III sliding clamp (beta) subunit (PCNA family)
MNITGAVQASELYNFLGKTKAEDIEVTLADNELKITAGKGRAGLVLNQEIKLPLGEIGGKGKWNPLPEKFTEAVKFVLFTCSRDMSRPKLTCVHVRKDGKIETSDGYRITQFQIAEMPVPAFLLPGSAAQDLVKYPIAHVGRGKGWMHFKTKEDTVFSCRTFEDEFVATEPHITFEGLELKFPQATGEILERAAVFAKRDHFLDESVTIQIAERKLTIEAKNPYGWFKESSPMQYTGEPRSFVMNPQFLKDIIGKLRTCILKDIAIRFAGEEWVYVSALKRDE